MPAHNNALTLAVCFLSVSEYDGSLHVSIGARPVHARLVELPLGSGEPDGFGKQLPEGFEKDEAAMLDLGKGSGPMNHAFAIEGEYEG